MIIVWYPNSGAKAKTLFYEGFGLTVYRKPAWYTAMLGKAAGEMPDLEISVDGLQGNCTGKS